MWPVFGPRKEKKLMIFSTPSPINDRRPRPLLIQPGLTSHDIKSRHPIFPEIQDPEIQTLHEGKRIIKIEREPIRALRKRGRRIHR